MRFNNRQTKSQSNAVVYINRATGKHETETVYGEAELRFLYQTWLGAVLRRLFVTKIWFSKISACSKRSNRGKAAIIEFAQRYDVDIHEAEKPLAQYRSLDDFFTRRLKPGARKLCGAHDSLVSPADGRVMVYSINEAALLSIKNQHLSIQELLQNAPAAQELRDGSAVVIRLAPKDYHRFHFPADGIASPPQNITGELESVHPIALDSGARSFLNKRMLTVLDTNRFGRIYMVEVGALTIGTIVQNFQPGRVTKGAEKGYFRFGGSTVILLWGRDGPNPDQDLVQNSRRHIETLLMMGTCIACSVATNSIKENGSRCT